MNEKHKKAGKDMTDCAKKRFKQILAEEQPDCVFVFTTKGWKDCPPTLYEEKYNKRPKDLTDVCTWGQYDCDGHMVTAFGLHHPQGANTENMKKAVSKALDKARTLRTRA